MEHIGSDPSVIHGSLHGPGYSGATPITSSYTLPDGQRYTDAYHIFAIEWDTNSVRWYMDGINYYSITAADLPGEWVYDHPFFVILNIAVGGTWPGSPDGTTQFPQRMYVDYVRVYQR